MDVITMIGNTGTYLDSPFQRYAEGPDLAGLDLATLVGLPAEVFHLHDAWDASSRGIRPHVLADRDVAAQLFSCTPDGTACSAGRSTAWARRS